MIISASRRTDIPAFYGQWFVERLRAGFVYVRNPFYPRQVSMVTLDPGLVAGIVFWTKNPGPLLPLLHIIDDLGYMYFFQFTLTPYDKTLERNLPPKEGLIATFHELAEKLGPQRVVWRYDPIILNRELSLSRHVELFGQLAEELHGSCNRCVISFVDHYAKTKRNTNRMGLQPITEEDMQALGRELAAIASQFNLPLFTCSEQVDLRHWGISPGSCVDGMLIEELTGTKLRFKKDHNQRPACGCVESVDVGAYNTCRHGCLYCYATGDHGRAMANWAAHKPESPLLVGQIGPEDQITVRRP